MNFKNPLSERNPPEFVVVTTYYIGALPRLCQLQLRHIIQAGGCIYRLPPRAIELSDRVACLQSGTVKKKIWTSLQSRESFNRSDLALLNHIMCLKKWFIFVSFLFFCSESDKFQIESSDILRIRQKDLKKISQYFLTLLSNLKPYGDFSFQIFVAFSEYLNFTISTDKIVGDF